MPLCSTPGCWEASSSAFSSPCQRICPVFLLQLDEFAGATCSGPWKLLFVASALRSLASWLALKPSLP